MMTVKVERWKLEMGIVEGGFGVENVGRVGDLHNA